MEATMGLGGWVELAGDFGLPGRLYVRLTRVGPRFRVSEMYIDGQGEPIQPGSLRQFPLGMVEDWLAPDDVLESTENVAGVDLSCLASHFGTSFGAGAYKSGHTCELCGAPLKPRRKVAITDWVLLSRLAQRGEIPQVPSRPSARAAAAPEPISLADPIDGLTGAFLMDVAEAYRAAVGQGRTDPAVAIAALPTVNHSVRTVHSWIYKARKGGFLPPARRDGKV